jgi:hypothetical protein
MTIATGERLLASDINNLTFFPKGTVLMYSSAAWASASTGFKKLWHICDGATVNGYTTLNLTNKFIRGSTASGQTGGTDTAQVPKHRHTFTGDNQTGGFYLYEIDHRNYSGVFSNSYNTNDGRSTYNAQGGLKSCANVRFSMTPTGSISEEGSATADNKPAYCTVIFIEKVV